MHSPSAFETQSWSSSEMGDYIGMESCVDLQQNEEVVDPGGCTEQDEGCGKRSRRWAAMREKKEYPPPIPLLARTENLPSHMPWVLKRFHTTDGRLILKEERVRRHEYFRVHRSDGRLTLQLVPLDDHVLPLSPVFGGGDDEEDTEVTEDEVDVVEPNTNQDGDNRCVECRVDGGGDETREGGRVEEAVAVTGKLPPDPMAAEIGTVVAGGGGGGGGKCYSFSVRLNPCMFGMPVPAIRPVHI